MVMFILYYLYSNIRQMLMDEGMELKETDSIKKLMKNMNLTID